MQNDHLEAPRTATVSLFGGLFSLKGANDRVQEVTEEDGLNSALWYTTREYSELVAWINDYLTSRPQYVRLRDCRSEAVTSSTVTPQETVLSLVLFTLLTSDFQYSFNWLHSTSARSCYNVNFSLGLIKYPSI